MPRIWNRVQAFVLEGNRKFGERVHPSTHSEEDLSRTHKDKRKSKNQNVYLLTTDICSLAQLKAQTFFLLKRFLWCVDGSCPEVPPRFLCPWLPDSLSVGLTHPLLPSCWEGNPRKEKEISSISRPKASWLRHLVVAEMSKRLWCLQ